MTVANDGSCVTTCILQTAIRYIFDIKDNRRRRRGRRRDISYPKATMYYYVLLKTGSLDNANREFSLA